MSKNEQEHSQRVIIGGIINDRKLEELYKSIELGKSSFDIYIIAYLDFLGFSERMNSENSYESLRILKFLLQGTITVADDISRTNKIDDFDIKIFSDNIVIAQKADQGILGNQVFSMVNLIASVQFYALMYFGFFMRGGISIGELSIDSTVVWGTGLIDAYNIETDLANYPRIVLSNHLIDEYNSSGQKELNLYAFIKEDYDGLWFIDFLYAAPNLALLPVESERLYEIVKPYTSSSDKVKQRVNWMINYFNTHCRKFKDRGDYEKYTLPYV